jgi:triphosphatase
MAPRARSRASRPTESALPVEVELKYRATDRGAAERLLESAAIGSLEASGEIVETHHGDRYFDTETGALRKAGYAGRIRETPNGALVTLKSLTSSDSPMHRRHELEAPATPRLQPLLWPPSEARSLLLELAGDQRLVETVRLDQRRRRRCFGRDGTAVELSLDDVRVLDANEEVDRFVQLEAELTRGNDNALDAVAAVIDALPGIEPAKTSKLDDAERALAGRAAGRVQQRRVPRRVSAKAAAPGPSDKRKPDKRTPDKRATPGVSGEDSLDAAGRKVLAFHLDRMIARASGARSGRDPEDIHAMRVATRRQRAAWRTFRDALPRRRSKALRRGLRDVASALGRVRDLDVLIDAAVAYDAALAPSRRGALAPLLAAWRRDREEARSALVAELDSRRYRRFVRKARDFVRQRDDVPAADLRVPHLVRDTAPARIWEAYQIVRAYESVLDWADTATLHALRIAAKRLRYALEFFGDALGPDAPHLIESVVALQDALGSLHDADVAAHLIRDFLMARGTVLSARERTAIGRYLLHCEDTTASARRSMRTPWRGVAGVRFRKGLGRALAVL